MVFYHNHLRICYNSTKVNGPVCLFVCLFGLVWLFGCLFLCLIVFLSCCFVVVVLVVCVCVFFFFLFLFCFVLFCFAFFFFFLFVLFCLFLLLFLFLSIFPHFPVFSLMFPQFFFIFVLILVFREGGLPTREGPGLRLRTSSFYWYQYTNHSPSSSWDEVGLFFVIIRPPWGVVATVPPPWIFYGTPDTPIFATSVGMDLLYPLIPKISTTSYDAWRHHGHCDQGGRTRLPKFKFGKISHRFTRGFINTDKKIQNCLISCVQNYFKRKSVEVQRWPLLK